MKRVLFSFLCLSVMFSSVCFGEVVFHNKGVTSSECVNLFGEVVSEAVELDKLYNNKEYRKYIDTFSKYDNKSDKATMQCGKEKLWVLADELFELNLKMGMKYLEQVGRVGL